jgi:hypothetical protein
MRDAVAFRQHPGIFFYIVAPTAAQIDEFYSKPKAREWIFLPLLR